jgi:hypothetical protein
VLGTDFALANSILVLGIGDVSDTPSIT